MSAPLDGVAWLETPEQLGFRVQLAGPAQRGMAWLLDGLFQLVALAVLGWVFGGFGGLGLGLLFISLFFFTWFYFTLFEMTMEGQSPGKRVLKLRVTSDDGLLVSARQSILRNLLRGVDILLVPSGYIIPLGALPMLLDPRMRRFGDMVAGTVVLAESESAPVRAFGRPSAEELRRLPPTVPLDREDLEALDGFASRSHLGQLRRSELADIIAPTYAQRLGRPPPDDSTRFVLALWARGRRVENTEPR